MYRPLDLTLVALYHAAFSAVLLGVIAWQCLFHPPTAAWTDSLPVILMMLFASLIPAVLCLGLWLMDSGARIGALLFTLFHILLTAAWISSDSAPNLLRPGLRIAFDLWILYVLLRPGVRRAFQESDRLMLGLGGISGRRPPGSFLQTETPPLPAGSL
ncbi:MAG TPA: hypothetical protein VE825_02335 [Terriglobales bacterium]|jgi:hypothetical protein|nr:hypothetical protein [Terriglobales bacterium]